MVRTRFVTIVTHTDSMSTHPSSVELNYGSYVPITYSYGAITYASELTRAHLGVASNIYGSIMSDTDSYRPNMSALQLIIAR